MFESFKKANDNFKYSELYAMWYYFLKQFTEDKLDQHSELQNPEHQKMLSQKKKACWIHPQES